MSAKQMVVIGFAVAINFAVAFFALLSKMKKKYSTSSQHCVVT